LDTVCGVKISQIGSDYNLFKKLQILNWLSLHSNEHIMCWKNLVISQVEVF
jgi:hypothetical protein